MQCVVSFPPALPARRVRTVPVVVCVRMGGCSARATGPRCGLGTQAGRGEASLRALPPRSPKLLTLSSTVTGRTRHRSTRSEAVAHSQRKASAISESRRRECESNEWSQCGWGERARERARVTGGVYPVWGMIARRAAWRLGWRRARDRRAQGQARRGNGGWRHGECRLVFLRFPRGFSPAPRLSGVGGGRARSTRLTADVVR